MSNATVVYEERGAVALVTLNRPDALNSFTRQMHRDLWAALDRAEANAQVRALVITGAGRGFCAGADLAEFDFAPGPDLVKRADPGPVIDQASYDRLMAYRQSVKDRIFHSVAVPPIMSVSASTSSKRLA